MKKKTGKNSKNAQVNTEGLTQYRILITSFAEIRNIHSEFLKLMLISLNINIFVWFFLRRYCLSSKINIAREDYGTSYNRNR